MATMMPITGGAYEEVSAQLSSSLPETEYVVEVTPTSGSYACIKIGIEAAQYGSAPGEALTVSVPTVDGGIGFYASAYDEIPQSEDDDAVPLGELRVNLFQME